MRPICRRQLHISAVPNVPDRRGLDAPTAAEADRVRRASDMARFGRLAQLLLAVSAAGAPASASSIGAVPGLRVTAGVFSPNGDGSDDQLVIGYDLPRDADLVQLRISELSAGPSRRHSMASLCHS